MLISGRSNMDKIALICSSGGHLFQLFRLRDSFEKYPRFWVTFLTEDAQVLLKNEKVYCAYSPTNRNVINFIRNFFLALKIVRKERPTVMISTGAGVAVPFFYLGRMLGIKTIYLESLARIDDLSLSGKMVYHFADHFLVQWEDLARRYKKAVYAGKVI